MTKTHIIYIPFTGVGKVQYKGDEWLKDRIEIFKNYTLKSLLNQTNQDFVLWLSFRPEEKENEQVQALAEYLKELGLKWLFTHQGLMYFDDRNPETTATLKFRLYKALKWVNLQLPEQTDWIYLTRVDSDDLEHKDVIDLIQAEKPFEGFLTLQNGYIYNKDTNELAEWNPLTNPPFHTIMMPREVFFDPERHIQAYGGFKSHEDVAREKHKVLWRGDNRLDRLYMVFTHNPQMHISTTWNHPFKGKLITENKEQILKEFGIAP